jgi:hypothetical protein
MTAAAWAVLLAVLVVGWVVLDGAVQGAGANLLQERDHDGGRRRREPTERRVVLAAVGPLLLPGEVWLVAAFGVLVGVFPHAGADLLNAGYPVAITLVGSWALRGAGFWLRGRRPGRVWRDVWDVVLVVASIVLAGSWGALLGVAWGSGLAALALGIVAVVVTRLHGDALVAWRLRRTGPLPVIVTTVMIMAPVVGTAGSSRAGSPARPWRRSASWRSWCCPWSSRCRSWPGGSCPVRWASGTRCSSEPLL